MKREKTQTPGVYRRGAGYEIAYTDSTGRRVFKRVPGGYKDACRALASIKERMFRGEFVAPSKLTVSELADRFMDEHTRNLKNSTRRTYQGSIDAHIKRRLGNHRVSSVSKKDIAGLVSSLRETHSAWTIHGALTPLSRMFDLAIDEGWAASNPVKALSRNQRPSGYTKPMRILDRNEINLLLKNASDGSRLLFTTAIFTGLRSGELFRLKWEDIDFAKMELIVKESKTSAGVRSVVVPDFLVTSLAAKSLVSHSQHPFQTGNQTLGSWAGNARLRLRNALKRCGVTDRVRFHDLRHTYASILIGQGLDVTYVAQQMGHASPAITMSTYAKLFDPESRKAEARKLLSVFEEVVG